MRIAIALLTCVGTAGLLAAPAAAAEERAGVTVGPYYHVSIPLAGEDAGSSWAGGAARCRVEWSDALAVSAAFTYDRHEFPGPEPVLEGHTGQVVERQVLSFRGGVIYNLPLAFTYPYAGGGAVLAREKTYFRSGELEPRVRYHPGLYGEAGTYVPLVGPLVVDAGPELTVLFGKLGGDYDHDAGGYEDTGGVALYFGFKAGVGIFF
jgi:hypothetical protein